MTLALSSDLVSGVQGLAYCPLLDGGQRFKAVLPPLLTPPRLPLSLLCARTRLLRPSLALLFFVTDFFHSFSLFSCSSPFSFTSSFLLSFVPVLSTSSRLFFFVFLSHSSFSPYFPPRPPGTTLPLFLLLLRLNFILLLKCSPPLPPFSMCIGAF